MKQAEDKDRFFWGKFAKKNVTMTAALGAAVITAFFVSPDEAYPGYFDFKTLPRLFCVLAVVCALKNIRFFYILALVYIPFLGSMLIANDMTLL